MENALLNVSNMSVVYNTRGRPVTALDDVSLSIPAAGYTLGVVGESGSGKSTLGMGILNLIDPPGRIVKGSIEYEGKDVVRMSKNELRHYRWKEVAMVYQSAMNSLNPVKRINDPIVEVLQEHTDISKRAAYEQALKLLSEVGIQQDRANNFPHQLSGGMRQRVSIALALALSPKLLIADEPTSALDVVTQKQIKILLKKEIRQRKLSLLYITHEIAALSGLVDNVAVMYAGEIVELGPHDKVLFKPLHPYTEMLLSDLLTMESDLGSISGSTVEPHKYQSKTGLTNFCKYVNRCKYAFDRCTKDRPRLKEVENGRWVACHKFA
ncbi:MAG: ABC transporter ATP-binding protein [Nitrososphaerales archaeon]